MNKNTECLVDENGFEIMVIYDYENLPDGKRDTYLQSIELIVKGRGMELLLLFDEKQKQSIIDKLTYE